MKRKLILGTLAILAIVVVAGNVSAEIASPPNNVVAGVIGASYENGQASENHPLSPNGWYFGGAYRTWVDHLAVLTALNYHWLNYARGGAVSSEGNVQLDDLLAQTVWPGPTGPVSQLNTLVIGAWGNDFLWFPAYNQQAVDLMIQNTNDQIATAKAAGVQKIIVTGLPEWDVLDLDYFLTLFPLPGHIDQAGYEQARAQYHDAFKTPNADYVFVETWCSFETFDGVHPTDLTSMKASAEIFKGVTLYNYLVGKKSLLCQ